MSTELPPLPPLATIESQRHFSADQMHAYARAAVLAERRQVEAEGWTPEHDDEHKQGTLAQAGACYAYWAFEAATLPNWVPPDWPWDDSWWKPGKPRKMLVKAVALGLAEIERIDHAAGVKEPGNAGHQGREASPA